MQTLSADRQAIIRRRARHDAEQGYINPVARKGTQVGLVYRRAYYDAIAERVMQNAAAEENVSSPERGNTSAENRQVSAQDVDSEGDGKDAPK